MPRSPARNRLASHPHCSGVSLYRLPDAPCSRQRRRCTPINSLALPPVTTIEGNVTRVDADGFVLADSSDSIYVRASLPDSRKLELAVHERVKVYGNLQGGQDRIFDGYVIKRASGEQIIVTNPTPHFGCVIQTSFQ